MGVRVGIAASVIAATLASNGVASAQSTIAIPGERAHYRVEAEPHLVAGLFNPPGSGTGSGFGAGVRASVEIVDDGFVASINNSIAIGFGADFVHYQGSGAVTPGTCTRFVSAPAGTNVCVEVSQRGGPSNYALFPVVMQWNFWLTRTWSVFGEPGLSLYWFDYSRVGASPAFYLGGRFHISDGMTITLRLGYPTLSIGVSFLL